MTETARPVLGMVLKGYPRISETFISNEILLLEKSGFSIRIFSMRRPREPFSHGSVKQIRARADYLPETIRPHLARLLRHNLRAARRSPRRYLRALGLTLKRFRRTRKSATLKHLLQAGYLVDRLLPESGVTHLHAHFAHSPASVAMFASVLAGIPFSFTAHAKDIYTSDPRQLAEKLGLARFVVTCTEYNRRHLQHLAPPGAARPVYRVYHGIDLKLFQNRAAPHPPAPPYRILTVARLTAKKGLPTVLAALERLAGEGIPFEYTLIGDGDDREALLGRIRDLGLEDRVRWLGTLPHEEVLEHYRRADLFVLGCEVASNGDRDGIPNVLLEGMAMGVPVVATRISAIPELVAHGRTGLLVPPGNPEEMAAAMMRLLTDHELRGAVIPAARETVGEGFDNRRLIGELVALYRQEGIGLSN